MIGGLGLAISMQPPALTVVFGKNDSGKTTLLHAVEQLFSELRGERTVFTGDRYHKNARAEGFLFVELEGLGVPDHHDEWFFRQLLQYGHVWIDVDPPPVFDLDYVRASTGSLDEDALMEYWTDPRGYDVTTAADDGEDVIVFPRESPQKR